MVIQQVVHQAPALLRNGVKFTPTVVTKKALQLILNQFFRIEIQNGQLDFLQHQTMRVSVPDLNLSFQVTLEPESDQLPFKLPLAKMTALLRKPLRGSRTSESDSNHNQCHKQLKVSLIAASNSTKASVNFTGNMDDLYLIATQRTDPDTLFFQRKLKITGDTELGLALKNLLDTIELGERLPGFMHQWSEQIADELERQRSEQEPLKEF